MAKNDELVIIDHRAELVEAAKKGVREYLRSVRGAALFGAGAEVLDDPDLGRFVVKFGNSDFITFDAFE